MCLEDDYVELFVLTEDNVLHVITERYQNSINVKQTNDILDQ